MVEKSREEGNNMAMNQAFTKDALRSIEKKLDRLLVLAGEPDLTKTATEQVTPVVPMTKEEAMARVRSFRKVNTGEGGRG
jgi:hypothetical protein